MTRSRRHSPFVALNGAKSDKAWKQQNARHLRRAARQTLAHTEDGDAVPVSPYAMGAADWQGDKDGKRRIEDPTSKDLRK